MTTTTTGRLFFRQSRRRLGMIQKLVRQLTCLVSQIQEVRSYLTYTILEFSLSSNSPPIQNWLGRICSSSVSELQPVEVLFHAEQAKSVVRLFGFC